MNFYYGERCGFDVPGVHHACHQDWQGTHDGQTKTIYGTPEAAGYHVLAWNSLSNRLLAMPDQMRLVFLRKRGCDVLTNP